jgi:hypothetical protein
LNIENIKTKLTLLPLTLSECFFYDKLNLNRRNDGENFGNHR